MNRTHRRLRVYAIARCVSNTQASDFYFKDIILGTMLDWFVRKPGGFLFDEKLEITPDNLVAIARGFFEETLVSLPANEYGEGALWCQFDLQVRRDHPSVFVEIRAQLFHDDVLEKDLAVLGIVSGLPLTETTCRVKIEVSKPGQDLMEMLAALGEHILKEIDGEERSRAWKTSVWKAKMVNMSPNISERGDLVATATYPHDTLAAFVVLLLELEKHSIQCDPIMLTESAGCWEAIHVDEFKEYRDQWGHVSGHERSGTSLGYVTARQGVRGLDLGFYEPRIGGSEGTKDLMSAITDLIRTNRPDTKEAADSPATNASNAGDAGKGQTNVPQAEALATLAAPGIEEPHGTAAHEGSIGKTVSRRMNAIGAGAKRHKAKKAMPIKNKRGKRSQYNMQERDQLVQKWMALDKDEDPRTIDVFLIDETGEKDEGQVASKPIVAPRTFFKWQDNYYLRHPKLKRAQ